MKFSLPHSLIFTSLLLFSGLFPWLHAGSSGSLIATAHADDTVVLSRCTLRGVAPTSKGQPIFDAAKGGRLLGQFSGAIGPVSATLPIDLTGRAKITTSANKPTVRIQGWTPTSAFSIYTARDVPVLAGSLWLAAGYKITPIKIVGDQLTAELTIQVSQDRKIQGSAACDSFSLERVKPIPQDIPGNARGYLTKGTSFTLFDGPNGTEILNLALAEGASQLFWSTQSRGAFVHVLSRGDIVVDAWVRLRELSPLKKGEMMDQQIPPSTQVAGAQLKLSKEPRNHSATKEIPIRLHPDTKEPVIGVIEMGAEFLEVGSTPKWLNILPKELHVTPPSDSGFWILADTVAP